MKTRILRKPNSRFALEHRLRARQNQDDLHRNPLSIDVVVTTYEMMVSKNTKHLLARVVWRYVVIDEGHKVKNEMTNISNQMLRVNSEGRICLRVHPPEQSTRTLGFTLLSSS